MATVGMVIASRMRSIENFAGIMNFLMFPMFFLSGALYPASLLPGWMQPLVRANPLTYGIDLMRHPLLRGLYPGNLGTDYTVAFDVMALVLISAIMLTLASLLFGEEEHLGRILLVEAPRAKKGSRVSRPKRSTTKGDVKPDKGSEKTESAPAATAPYAGAPPADWIATPRSRTPGTVCCAPGCCSRSRRLARSPLRAWARRSSSSRSSRRWRIPNRSPNFPGAQPQGVHRGLRLLLRRDDVETVIIFGKEKAEAEAGRRSRGADGSPVTRQ